MSLMKVRQGEGLGLFELRSAEQVNLACMLNCLRAFSWSSYMVAFNVYILSSLIRPEKRIPKVEKNIHFAIRCQFRLKTNKHWSPCAKSSNNIERFVSGMGAAGKISYIAYCCVKEVF